MLCTYPRKSLCAQPLSIQFLKLWNQTSFSYALQIFNPSSVFLFSQCSHEHMVDGEARHWNEGAEVNSTPITIMHICIWTCSHEPPVCVCVCVWRVDLGNDIQTHSVSSPLRDTCKQKDTNTDHMSWPIQAILNVFSHGCLCFMRPLSNSLLPYIHNHSLMASIWGSFWDPCGC